MCSKKNVLFLKWAHNLIRPFLEFDQNGMCFLGICPFWNVLIQNVKCPFWNVLEMKCALFGMCPKLNGLKIECAHFGMWTFWNMIKADIPPRPSEISMKNWRAKVKPVF